ncbi:hypothetical protein BV25DRAFT_1296423 [Artomyces pyxidatus]|uniref:Uncharacterized protein n=1 Tax=Artomyces pyxidatus TaxID=48021 RepID=A0ACB8SPG9_9AGAM|nr:hypothetical protein BV25DRAFT_1296423 [Artomyces pyxidatus]
MDNDRVGAVAATCSKDGTRIKIVVVTAGGRLLDADCQLLAPGVDPNSVPGVSLEVAEDEGRKVMSKWTEGTCTDVGFERSMVAGCTVGTATDIPCFFYQGVGTSIYMKTFGRENSGAWDTSMRVVNVNDSAYPPYPGTALSAHPDGTGEYVYLYYQANRNEQPGEIIGLKLSISCAVVVRGGPIFKETLPLGTPFAVIFRDGLWSMFYSGERGELLGEAYGGIKPVTVDPATGGDSEEFYTTRAPTHFIKPGPYPLPQKTVQVAACHCEKPICFIVCQPEVDATAAPLIKGRVIHTYKYDPRGLNGSGIALVSHIPQYKAASLVFVDRSGAVNFCRSASEPTVGTKGRNATPYPIPLDSMRTAFAYAAEPIVPPVLPNPPVLPLPPAVPDSVPPPSVSNPTPPATFLDPVSFKRELVQIVGAVVQQEFAKRDAQAASRKTPGPSPAPFPGIIGRPFPGGVLPPIERSSDRKKWAKNGCLETPWKKPPTVHGGAGHNPLFFVLGSEDKLWQSNPQKLKYFFMNGTEAQKAKVNEVVHEWELYASVEFEQVFQAADSVIRIKFNADDGSWSYVGRDCATKEKTEPTMNLGALDPDDSSVTPKEHGVILHEFGHALGLLHEHQSPAQGSGGTALDEKGTILFYKESPELHWSEDMIREQILDVYADKEVSNFSELDRTSIMHYPLPRQVTGLSYDIPYNTQLSLMDKAYMVINYPRAEPHPDAPEWTLEAALQKAGVPADVQKTILSVSPRKGRPDAAEIRRLFSSWVMSKRHDRRKGGTGKAGKQHALPEVPRPVRFLTDPKSEDLSVVAQSVQKYGDCSNTEVAQVHRKGAAHAVVLEAALWDIDQSDDGNPDFVMSIPYTWAAQNDTVLTSYRKQTITSAMTSWAEYASIEFDREPQGSPKLVVAFQDGRPDDALRSYTHGLGKNLKPFKGDVGVLHSVCYRMFLNRESAAAYDKANSKKGEMCNRRTALHELGHVLGLKHECNGFLASLMNRSNPAVKNPKVLDKTSTIQYDDVKHLLSTKYDFTTVMDVINIQARNMAVDLISRYSLDVDWDSVLDDHDRVKVTYKLSEYDIANIALLYPGRLLIGAVIPGEEAPFDLHLQPADPDTERRISTVRHYCEILGLSQEATDIIEEHAAYARWTSLRRDYLVALQEAMSKYWREHIEAFQRQILGQVVKPTPSRGLNPPDPRRQRALDPSTPVPPPNKSFKDILYEKLDSVFGSTGNQYLALQLPTRYLDKSSFAYKTSGIYSNFTKPVVVNEAEFRLTDELFDVAKVVSGPNGKSLSLLYEQALNNLVPKYQSDSLRTQRERIRNWLLTKVDNEYINGSSGRGSSAARALGPDNVAPSAPKKNKVYGIQEFAKLIDPDDPTLEDDELAPVSKKSSSTTGGDSGAGSGRPSYDMTRIEFSQSLMLEYLKERMDWELTRDKMIRKAMESGDTKKLEQVTRLLAHITAVHENRLAAKYGDVVVRGHLHTVREYLGYLDVKSTAESLQSAKDSLRESAMSSVYGSRVIYPVLMQPVDWFEALDTSFASEDLSQSVEVLQLQLTQKSTRLDTLNDQLSTYMFATEGNVDTLTTEVENLTRARDDASAKLTRQYTQATINAAKMYLEASSGGTTKVLGKIGEGMNPPDEAKSLLDVIDLTVIADGINAVSEADGKLLSAGRSLAGKLAQLEKARATDTRAQQAVIQRQITKLRAEIQELYEQLEIATLAKKKRAERVAKSMDGVGLPPANDARWIDISFETSVSNKVTTRETSSSASTSSWNVNLWLGSASGNSSSSSASMSASDVEQHVKVSISLRVSLVTVDRSSWFQPQFFDMSDAFMRASEHVRWSEWPKDVNTAADAIKRIKAATEGGGFDAGQSLLPAFPVGYIIAKDVLVKLSSSSSSSSSSSKSFSEQAAASGGVLCFSYSHASQSSGDSSSVSTQEMADGLVIKIPGPQILGYMMQLTPKDATHKFESSDDSYFLPSDVPPETGSGGKPARALPITKPTDATSTTTTSKQDTIHTNGSAAPNGNADGADRESPRAAAGIMEDIHALIRDPTSLGLVLDMAKLLKNAAS